MTADGDRAPTGDCARDAATDIGGEAATNAGPLVGEGEGHTNCKGLRAGRLPPLAVPEPAELTGTVTSKSPSEVPGGVMSGGGDDGPAQSAGDFLAISVEDRVTLARLKVSSADRTASFDEDLEVVSTSVDVGDADNDDLKGMPRSSRPLRGNGSDARGSCGRDVDTDRAIVRGGAATGRCRCLSSAEGTVAASPISSKGDPSSMAAGGARGTTGGEPVRGYTSLKTSAAVTVS